MVVSPWRAVLDNELSLGLVLQSICQILECLLDLNCVSFALLVNLR
jgi:hypothetical protein